MPDFDIAKTQLQEFPEVEHTNEANLPRTTFQKVADPFATIGRQDSPAIPANVFLGMQTKQTPKVGASLQTLEQNKRYDLYEQGQNYEDFYAQAQPWYKQIGNGLVKAGAFTLGTFAQSFNSIPSALSGDLTGNNSYEKPIDDWMKNFEDSFPNYYSDYEKEHPFKSIIGSGFANTLGDKFIKNLGFMAGSIGGAVAQDFLVGLVTEGLGEIPMVANQIGKASLWLNKIFSSETKLGLALGATEKGVLTSFLEVGKDAGRTEQQLARMESLAQLAASKKINNQFRYALNNFTASRTEAGVEARDGYRTLKNDLIAQYKLDNYGQEPKEQDLKDIEDIATQSMNARFIGNMGLLTISNAIQFENVLKPFGASRTGLNSPIFKEIANSRIGLEKGLLEGYSEIVPKTISGRIGQSLKPYVPELLSEGVFEEGGQFAIEKGTYDYYKNKYNNSHLASDDSRQEVASLINSISKGLGAQFGTTEGVENMFLGALTAGLTGKAKSVYSNVKGTGSKAQIAAELNNLNSNQLTGVFTTNFENAAAQLEASKQMEQAVKDRDIYAYKNAQFKSLFNWVNSRLDSGRFELLQEEIKLAKELSNDEFKKMFGLDISSKSTVNDYLSLLETQADKIKTNYEKVNDVFNNPYEYIRTPKDEKEQVEQENYRQYESYKAAMVYIPSLIDHFNNRKQKIQEELSSISPLLNTKIVKQLTNQESLSNLAKEYEQEASNLLKEEASPKEKRILENKAKTFRNLAESIYHVINNSTDTEGKPQAFPKVFNALATFELNGRNENVENSIIQHPLDVEKALVAGYDINQMDDEIKAASKAFDFLTGEKGFEEFKKSLTPKQVENPTFEEGRQYESQSKKQYTTKKVADDRFQVIAPNKDVISTHPTREEAQESTKPLNEKLKETKKVEVIRENENGTIRVKDINGDVIDISKEELSKYKSLKTEKDILLENKETVDKNYNITPTQNEEVIVEEQNSMDDESFSGKMKDISFITLTGTDGKYEDGNFTSPNNDAHKRHQLFELNALPKLLKDQVEVKILPVNINNQKDLGFEDLVDPDYPNSVRFLYVTPTETGLKFFNEKGDIIDTPDTTKVIFTTAVDPLLTYAKTGKDNFTNKSNLEVDKIKLEYTKRHKTWVENKELPNPYSFNTSLGFPLTDKDNYRRTKISELNLVTNKELRTERVVNVNSIGVSFGDKVINIPKGFPYYSHNNVFLKLDSRRLNTQEINTVATLLQELKTLYPKQGQEQRIKEITSYLQGIVFFKPLNKSKQAIYWNGTGFTINEKQTQSLEEMKEALQSSFHYVNAEYLNEFAPFLTINPGKAPIEHQNYQTYLLENVLTTNAKVPINDEIAIVQKYPILNIDIALPISNTEVKTATKTPSTQPTLLDPSKGLAGFKGFTAPNAKLVEKEPEIIPEPSPIQETSIEQPKEDVWSTDLNNLPNKGFINEENFDDDDEDFGTSSGLPKFKRQGTNLPQGDKEKELEEVKQMLPNVDVKMLTNIISQGNIKAWGAATPSFIYLYENAPYGVAYHETFEQVFNFILPLNEQKELWNEFKSQEGEFITFKGETKQYKDATFLEAKEEMADRFAEYKTSGKLPIQEKQKSFFEKLWNFITSLFKSKTTLNEVFEKLSKGVYGDSPILANVTTPQFKRFVQGEAEAFVQDVVSGITAATFMNTISTNAKLLDLVEEGYSENLVSMFNGVKETLNNYFTNQEQSDKPTLATNLLHKVKDKQATIEEVKEEWKNINQAWDKVNTQWENYVRDSISFLKQFGVNFDIDDLGSISFVETEQREYLESEDKLFLNPKNRASLAVKLLIATVADSKRLLNSSFKQIVTNIDDNSMKLPKLAPYASLFNYALHQSANSNGLQQILPKLQNSAKNSLAKQGANLQNLLNKLDFNGDFTNLDLSTIKVLLKLENTLTKQKPTFYKQVWNEKDKTFVFVTSDLNSSAKQLTQELLINLKQNPLFFKSIEGVPTLTKDVIGKTNLETLRNLGYQIDEISPNIKDRISKELLSLKENIQDIKAVESNLNRLSEIYVKNITGDQTDSQLTNIEGNKQSQFGLNNSLSYVINDAQNLSYDDFIEQNPQFKDSYMGSSLLLQNIKDEVFIPEIVVTEGLSTSMKKTPHDQLSIGERVLYEINNNLNNVYYTLVPADAKTPWAVKMFKKGLEPLSSSYITKASNLPLESYYSKMYGVLKNEFELAKDYSNRNFVSNLNIEDNKIPVGKSLRFFKHIVSPSLNSTLQKAIDDNAEFPEIYDEFKSDLNKFLLERLNATKSTLQSYDLLNGTQDGVFGIDSNFKTKTKQELDRLLFYREANYVFANIEQHKFFFNDPAQYKDALKRIKSFTSGRDYTHKSLDTSTGFNARANILLNSNLEPTDWGYNNFTNTFNSITLKDITQTNPLKGYEKNNVTDAQSAMLLTKHREFLYKAGGRYSNKQEQLYQWLQAYERQAAFKKGLFSEYRESLKKQDEETLSKPIPNAILQTLKPIITGTRLQNGVAVQYLYKTSTFPLSLYFVEGTQFEEFYWNMVKSNTHFIAFDSANKVGETLGNTIEYSPSQDLENTPKVQIDWRNTGIQVETDQSKDTNTQGSQATKLILQDLFDNGKPSDFKGTYEEWTNLSEEEKLKNKKYQQVKEHSETLTQLALARKEKVFKKFGITKEEGKFLINKQKVSDFILSELTRRELPNNVGEGLEVTDNKWNQPIETNVSYSKIKSIIWSSIENNITRPKVNGKPGILVSNFFFDNFTPKTVNGKTVYTSDKFKFYTKEDGKTQACQIGIPYFLGDRVIKLLETRNKKQYTNQKEAYKDALTFLNSTEEGKEILKGIGFRIPTQGLNSIDYFEVVEFFPLQLGDVVVFPSEITTKAGSDFDVDKMNMYLKNFYISGDNIKLVPSFSSLEESKQFILKEQLTDLLTNYYKQGGDAIDKLEEEDFEEGVDENDKIALSFYIKGLENKMFKSMQNILEDESNFDRLITPNDAAELKSTANQIKKLTDVKQQELPGFTKFIDSSFMTQTRHTFLLSKKDVGLAATSQTQLALLQLGNNSVDYSKTKQRNFQLRLGESIYIGNAGLASNRNSQVIDGTVDVAKDPYLPIMLPYKDMLTVYLYLTTKADVEPFKTALFLNQPIIKQYLKAVQIKNNIINYNPTIKDKYSNPLRLVVGGYLKNTFYKTALYNAILDKKPNEYSTQLLKDQLNNHDANTQIQILSDFLGYKELATAMFQVKQATDWDTANFSSPENVELKKLEYQAGINQEVTPSTVPNILNNSFIKELKTVVEETNDALSQLSDTLKDYYLKEQAVKLKQSFISSDDFVHNMQVAESSLITYLLLNYGKFNGFNIKEYKSLYFGDLNIAQYILKLQSSIKNPALDYIQVDKGLIKLKTRPTDTYTQNVITSGFKELFQDGTPVTVQNKTLLISDIAQRIVLTQLLQYGTGYNRKSLLEFLPNEYVKPITSQANDFLQNSQEWYASDAFYRTNVNDDRIVPQLKGTYKEEEVEGEVLVSTVFGQSAPAPVLNQLHNLLNEEGIDIQNRAIGIILPEFKYASKPYVKTVTKDGVVLFKRVDNFGTPITYLGRPIFMAVQNLSNSPLINYIPSVRELNDQEVISAFQNNVPSETLNTITQQDLKNSQEFEEDVVSLPKEDMKQEIPFTPSTEVENAKQIYLKLGNKTVSTNIKIIPWGELKQIKQAVTDRGIVSTRIDTQTWMPGSGSENFGNPFSSDRTILSKNTSLIPTNSTKESVENYINWILTGKTPNINNSEADYVELDMQREWIIEQLKSGELKNKPILYYKELREPSHATALDYLINKYDWNNKITYLTYTKLLKDKEGLTEQEFNSLPIQNQQAVIFELENCILKY